MHGQLALVMLLALCSTSAFAQLDYRPTHVGRWSYEYTRSLAEPKLTAAERVTVLAQLRAIGDAIASLPLISPPKGVEILARERLDLGCEHNQRLCGLNPIPAWTEVSVMGFFVDGGRVVPKRIEPPGFVIAVNDPTVALTDHEYDFEHLVDAQGNEIVTGLREIERLNGASVYDNNVVVIARNQSDLTRPVSREAYLRALLKRHASESRLTELLNAELAALSPLERRSSAWIGAAETISRLVPPDTPDAAPLVTFNANYFDSALPRTAVQLIAIRFMYGNRYLEETPAPPDYAPDAIRTYEIRQAIDYNRLRRMLR